MTIEWSRISSDKFENSCQLLPVVQFRMVQDLFMQIPQHPSHCRTGWQARDFHHRVSVHGKLASPGGGLLPDLFRHPLFQRIHQGRILVCEAVGQEIGPAEFQKVLDVPVSHAIYQSPDRGIAPSRIISDHMVSNEMGYPSHHLPSEPEPVKDFPGQ